MNSSKTTKTRSSEMFAVQYDDTEMRAMARQQVENFWRAQERALDHIDGLAKDWLARRRQGTEAALDAARKLCACKDPSEASSVCGEWMTGSAERLADDARAFSERTMKMMQEMAEAASATATKSAETPPEKPAEPPTVKLARTG